METKTIFKIFFIITALVSYAYPSLGQENVDNEPLVKPGQEFDTLGAMSPVSKDYNIYVLKNLPPKEKKYLETCMEKMGLTDIWQCHADVIHEILTNEPVSKECCLKVIKAGKECHMHLTKLTFQFYQLKHFASQVSFKINEV
ncbi:unnamed protein product [Eruca vesicaria subsp. sativa]|uniref:Prolamin-like domain-containing protein n=1 Tax=Eruca vesicaria subsp. sativa TaxID=29727 RepID=A0ABC8JBF0_ERUVS|nr:unnamed protein product [Eruca vesicaria subsp. sativa]